MSSLFGILVLLPSLSLALIALFLITPLRLELQLSREEVPRFSAALRPFGHLGPRIRLSDGSKKTAAEMQRQSRKVKTRGGRKSDRMRIAQAAIRLAAELVETVGFESALLDLRFGLGDPAETGQLFGQLTPLIYGTPGRAHVLIDIRPVFDEATLKGRVALDLSLVPARLVMPIVRFAWSAFRPFR